MFPNPAIVNSIEKLGYQVSVGDVAASAGLEINQAQQGLLALASVAGGHLQVSESGEIAYLFPQNFRSILRNKNWRLRWQEWWAKVWHILFYLIRISFGIVLIISIFLMLATIAILIITVQSQSDSDNNSGGSNNSSSGGFFLPRFWFSPDIFWLFDPGYSNRYSRRQKGSHSASSENKLSFLAAVFSFLFGDGNPNHDLEERRWQDIGTVIRNHGSAVIAEQIAPYLDEIEVGTLENEDYMLPVLTRFNGYPEVSPQGQIIYYFPELQITATRREKETVPAFLREKLWIFSQASQGQTTLAICLGIANFVLALSLGFLLQNSTVSGGLVAFVDSIYWFLLGYGTAFLTIPLIRYVWIQLRNKAIKARNQKRSQLVAILEHADEVIQHKIAYAEQFASQKVISEDNLAYTTQKDLISQEIANSDQIDEEWQRRLESNS